MTSKWVRTVRALRDHTVDRQFISLRLLNSHIDYAAHFPSGYQAGHTAGLRLPRVAARTRVEHGRPILHFEPPGGVAFLGPVISRLPGDDQAVDLWDHVVALARFPRFRRAEAQPPRAAPAARPGRERARGGCGAGLARGQPPSEAVVPAAREADTQSSTGSAPSSSVSAPWSVSASRTTRYTMPPP